MAEKEYYKLSDQADYNKKVDPFKYMGKLVCSIMACTIAST